MHKGDLRKGWVGFIWKIRIICRYRLYSNTSRMRIYILLCFLTMVYIDLRNHLKYLGVLDLMDLVSVVPIVPIECEWVCYGRDLEEIG